MEYRLTRLPNGLRVLAVPMRERDSAAVAIWVRAGSRYEIKKISGISHFLEHMLFKGTKKRNTRQIKEEIEGAGGLLNAFTGEESTCYFAKLLKEHYPRALDVLSDIVNEATLLPKEVQKERAVILEEIKMYRDLPSHHVHDLMGELLWPNHPLGRNIAGCPETVSAMSRAEMVRYKKEHYHPKNILVSVAGPVGYEDVVERTQSFFTQQSARAASWFSKADSRQTKPRTLLIEKQTEQTHFVVGLHGLSRFHPDRYKLGLLNVILGANMSSRLFEEVREKRGLAYEIRSGASFYQDAGSFTVSAGVEAKKAPKAIAVILRELAKMTEKDVKAGELRRAQDYFMSQLYLALEDTLEHLLWAGERVLDRGEAPDAGEIRRGIEAVTAPEVREAAGRIFKTSNLNLTLIGPIPSKVQRQIKRDFELNAR